MSPTAQDAGLRTVVGLDDRLVQYREKVKYVLEEISARLCCALVLAADKETSSDVMLVPDRGVLNTLYFDKRCYDSRARFTALRLSGKILWVPGGTRLDDSIDHIGAVYRLLTLIDEAKVETRDRLGVFHSAALPKDRRETRALSLVENHCQMLAQELQINTSVRGSPWPGNFQYCLLLTHDTDAAALGATGEIVANLAKSVLRRDRRRFELAKLGWRYRSVPEKDPMFTFPTWRRELSDLGVNSSFYLSLVRTKKRDVHDVRSDVYHYTDSQLDTVRQMIDAGWEIGLHASIRSKTDLELLLSDKQRIERSFGVPVHGLRHHYWSLDWNAPYKTYRLHENAGFRYDLSMAWQDSVGLRAGTSLPFRPFDPERLRPLDLYVIPTAVLDDHVLLQGEGQCSISPEFAQIKQEVASVGGVLCLDWHTESASNLYPYEGHAEVLLAEIRKIRDEGDAWVTTPWNLVQYWHKRSIQYSERLMAPV